MMMSFGFYAAFLSSFVAIVSHASPVKVFVLAGQSNMEGKGSIVHLQELLNDTATAKTYRHLWDDDSNDWAQRDDVYITFNKDKWGKLTVGYGMPTDVRFGPELEFGNVVGDAFTDDEQVLIIKCAWGGRALALEFRPPSSGIGNYTHGNPNSGESVPYKPLEYGKAYRDMIEIVQETLADIKSVIPDYDGAGYELSGFVWFQGWNDIIDDAKTAEYGTNLANLIRDVRMDLEAPNLPFIIGELGQAGVDPDPRDKEKHLHFRKIQKDVTEMDEFRETTRFVKTSIYVVKDGESFDGGYHYYGRADTFFFIGKAFGKANLSLLQKDTPRAHDLAKVEVA